MTTELKINHVAETAALYRRYPRQEKPQPCFVELRCDTGRLLADYNPEIGNALPTEVWHSRTLRWTIPCLSAEKANALLDSIRMDAQAILDGYTVEWDGSNNVGKFTADAEAAQERIQDRCDKLDDSDALRSWMAEDWLLGDSCGVVAATTDEELETIATRVESEALASGECEVLDGCLAHLTSVRNRLQRECAE